MSAPVSYRNDEGWTVEIAAYDRGDGPVDVLVVRWDGYFIAERTAPEGLKGIRGLDLSTLRPA